MEIMTMAKLEMNTIKTIDFIEHRLKKAEKYEDVKHIEYYNDCLERLKKMKALFT